MVATTQDELNTEGVAGSADTLGVYVHVPYCSSRCGYCDFNTYVPGEEGRGNPAGWADTAVAEVYLRAEQVPSGVHPNGVGTIFFGGGTPTLLPPSDLGRVIRAVDRTVGISPGAEVTVEANPDTLTPRILTDLLSVGVNRISIGMQSADPRVLTVLDRQHRPGSAVDAVGLARAAGFEQISLDLVYGTPGETLESWSDTLTSAVSTGVPHISAYSLKVEAGTAMARKVGTGEIAPVDDDYCAAAYELADERLTSHGLPWYEISNWARPGARCRHNLGYWSEFDWWGIGPGAHGHERRGLGFARRYWNIRHPDRWQATISGNSLAEQGSEVLTADQLRMERVMLRIRRSEGLSASGIGQNTLAELVADGLIVPERIPDRVVLTRRGRLLADRVTITVLDALATR